MLFSSWNVGGEVVKQDERYIVKDNKSLKNLVVSSTQLNRLMSTSGHSHPGQEEVYIFTNGRGRMELDDKAFFVKEGDTVLVEDGVFHRSTQGKEQTRSNTR